MTEIADFVEMLVAAHTTDRRADASGLRPPDYATAMEIQRRVQARLGPVGGFKVAQRAEGPPVIAPIRADRVFASGSDISMRDQMGIELEIGFEAIGECSADMLAMPQRHFRPRIVLELVDTRFRGADDDPILKLTDMQINAGLVTGSALTDWDGTDFSTVQASLHCGGRAVVDGQVSVPGGSALENLALFLEHVGDHCGGLRAGQIVITGSLSGLDYFPAGTAVAGRIEGFGDVGCRLV